jgi:beta-glucosidase
MTSYNHVNNTKVCESYDLVTLIPRDEWGYSGVFATDWINDSIHVKELLAGHDLKMNEGDVDAVCLALENGTLSRERVKESAKRVLEFVMKSDYFKKKFNILD